MYVEGNGRSEVLASLHLPKYEIPPSILIVKPHRFPGFWSPSKSQSELAVFAAAHLICYHVGASRKSLAAEAREPIFIVGTQDRLGFETSKPKNKTMSATIFGTASRISACHLQLCLISCTAQVQVV